MRVALDDWQSWLHDNKSKIRTVDVLQKQSEWHQTCCESILRVIEDTRFTQGARHIAGQVIVEIELENRQNNGRHAKARHVVRSTEID